MKTTTISKFILIIVILLKTNTVKSQVPNWLKNAQPLTEKELKLIDKKGEKILKAYQDFPEDSDEKQITYRINNISYLQRLENLKKELLLLKPSEKPKPFPLYLSKFLKTSITRLEKFNSNAEINNKLIINDTIVEVVDAIYSYDYLKNNKFTTDNNTLKLNLWTLILLDDKGTVYKLDKTYYDLHNYPDFINWIEKYRNYGDKQLIKDKEDQKLKDERDALERIKQNEIDKKKMLEVFCTSSIDDFTGDQIIKTNKQILILIGSEYDSEEAKLLRKNGYNDDTEAFVCAFTASKTGNKKTLDVYIKYASEKALDIFGLIEKGALIEFKLENNKIVKLSFSSLVTPTIDHKYKASFYENSILISDKDVIELIASKVKKIRINYSKGFKDYDVTENGDMFIKQMKCIK